MNKNPFPPNGGSPLSSPRLKPGASRGYSVNARLRILMIGAGTMGSVHSRAYRRLADAELVGIVDPYPLGQALAETLNVAHYHALDDVADDAYDVVDICAPSPWHRPYVILAAEKKKAIFCEKPLALTLEDADQMLNAVHRHGVRFSVGHCVRFFPEYVRAKAVIDEGTLGAIAVVRTFRGGGFPTAWNDWYASRSLSGGTLIDLLIHDFDFLRWVLGPVARVYAQSVLPEMNRVDFSLVTLRFASGALAHVEGTWAHRQFGTRFEFSGSQGTLVHDSYREHPLNFTTTGPTEGVALPETPGLLSSYDLEIADFVDALRTDRPFRVSPDDAYQALRIALAASQSAQTGAVVTLEPESGSRSQGGAQ